MDDDYWNAILLTKKKLAANFKQEKNKSTNIPSIEFT